MSPRKRLRAALYARYSTDKQSENSVEDQFRVCTRLCEREGFTVADTFADAGISGGTTNRPGYQSLLEGARQQAFDVIVAEDTSRLWRELSEQWRALKELADLRIAVVTHDVDTRRQESKVLLSVTGAMSETYRDEIARRTRRGLEGRAVAGKSAGGRAYGYVPANRSSTGRVEIHEAEAAVVRRIFSLYDEGASPRSIVGRLNAERIPSPGAAWRRKEGTPNGKRTNGKWMASAIHGDARKGTGILNNERYRGVIVWGRTRWERGAADSAKRIATFNEDRSEWVIRQDESLRIVPEALWQRVKARQAAIAANSTKLRSACRGRRGRAATHLLTGILTCESCGSSFISVDRYSYGCSSHKNGGFGACTNNLRVRRETAERLLLEEIKVELLSDDAVAQAQKAMQDELRRLQSAKRPPKEAPAVASGKVAKLDAQIDQLRALMQTGTLSPAAGQAALDVLERDRAELIDTARRREAKANGNVVRMLPQTAEIYRAAVRDLQGALTEPNERLQARALIFELLGGKVPLRPAASERHLIARLSLNRGALLEAANGGKINNFQNGSGGRIWDLFFNEEAPDSARLIA